MEVGEEVQYFAVEVGGLGCRAGMFLCRWIVEVGCLPFFAVGENSLVKQLVMSSRSLPPQVDKDEEKTVLQDRSKKTQVSRRCSVNWPGQG